MTTHTIDWADVEAAAQEFAGNHRKFESFGWHDRPDDDQDWCIVYTHNRDSGLIDLSNAAAIESELARFMEAEDPDVVSEHHGHWGVGWVDGYAIRVYREGQVTEAFRKWCELQARLADYPLLDEEDYSRREVEAAHEAIEQEGSRMVRDDAPKDWPQRVYDWLSDNDQAELENRDDRGPYPSDEVIRDALEDLGWLDATYTVMVGDRVYLETDSKRAADYEYRTLVRHASMGIGIAAGACVTLVRDGEVTEEHQQ